MARHQCRLCGHAGRLRTKRPGSVTTLALLWLSFGLAAAYGGLALSEGVWLLLAGVPLAYMLWREQAARQVCRRCGSSQVAAM